MASGSKFVQITKELVNIRAITDPTEAEDNETVHGFIRNKLKEDIVEELPQPPHHDDHTYCIKVGVNCHYQILEYYL